GRVGIAAQWLADLQPAGGQVQFARVKAANGPDQRFVRLDRDDDGPAAGHVGLDALIGNEWCARLVPALLHHRPPPAPPPAPPPPPGPRRGLGPAPLAAAGPPGG